MKTLYAIRDRVANDLLTMQMYSVFSFKTDQQAVRYFADAVLDTTSVLNKHPADYELIRVGIIADDGEIATSADDPTVLLTGDTLVAAQPQLVKEA